MRDIDLIALRPPIPTIIDKNAVNPAELFQNRTLRPILKLQNDLLDAILKIILSKEKTFFINWINPKECNILRKVFGKI